MTTRWEKVMVGAILLHIFPSNYLTHTKLLLIILQHSLTAGKNKFSSFRHLNTQRDFSSYFLFNISRIFPFSFGFFRHFYLRIWDFKYIFFEFEYLKNLRELRLKINNLTFFEIMYLEYLYTHTLHHRLLLVLVQMCENDYSYFVYKNYKMSHEQI